MGRDFGPDPCPGAKVTGGRASIALNGSDRNTVIARFLLCRPTQCDRSQTLRIQAACSGRSVGVVSGLYTDVLGSLARDLWAVWPASCFQAWITVH